MGEMYHFSGWATRSNIKCSDGRTIMKDAFKHNDGAEVPLVWNHQHNEPTNILGHAKLVHRDGDIYTYCTFNDSEQGGAAKLLVEHGDIKALSIYANQLKQQGNFVQHGNIREVSLVLAGANPGAYIDNVLMHGEETDDEAIIYTGEEICLYHADDNDEKEDKKPDDKTDDKSSKKTLKDKEIFMSLNEEQQDLVYRMIGKAIEDTKAENTEPDKKSENPEGGEKEMKHNVFDKDTSNENFLSHADQQSIIAMAKTSSVGSLQDALGIYTENNKETLAHGIDDIESLFPDYKDVHPGAPELIERDQGWVGTVMKKTHKSPISRIRTRQADARGAGLRALGYKQKGDKKVDTGNIKLLKRTTDPQTIYIKDSMHRDDIIDITDFDVVNYQYGVMKNLMYEEIATAIMIGDGRDDGDEHKIDETHIRSIWHDDELYTIHTDVDIAAAKTELQGSNTSANFGDNYIYAEAVITAALYAREQYKGSGNLEFYCTPHLLNVMLLARDLNGRRIYSSKADLAAALNVTAIHTAEQFEGKTRTTAKGAKKNLLGIFVNLSDYQVGHTKGGEITKFNQFDIDFNQEKYLIETRLSGALTRIKSAIVLEEPVTE